MEVSVTKFPEPKAPMLEKEDGARRKADSKRGVAEGRRRREEREAEGERVSVYVGRLYENERNGFDTGRTDRFFVIRW